MCLPSEFLGQRKYAIGLIIRCRRAICRYLAALFQVFWASLPLPSLNERATVAAVAR